MQNFLSRRIEKKKLEDRLGNLKEIIFFRNAGNLFQRAERIQKIIVFISGKINFDLKRFYKYLIYCI